MPKQENQRNTLPNMISAIVKSRAFAICVCIFVVFILPLGIFTLLLCIPPKHTETTDILEYGQYDGTNNTRFTEQYIQSFFPEEIQGSFTNVQYSYKAQNMGAYCFEAYLEFTIEDEAEFQKYISEITQEENWKDFAYAPGYKEYSIENFLPWMQRQQMTLPASSI